MKSLRIFYLAGMMIVSLLAGAQTAQPVSGTPGSAAAAQHQTALQPPSVHKAKLPLPENNELPSAAGELPLLSMVGFGVLLGGTISAMRTRRK